MENKPEDGVYVYVRIILITGYEFDILLLSQQSVFSHVASSHANLVEQKSGLRKERVKFPQDWFGTRTWPSFHSFGTPYWPP